MSESKQSLGHKAAEHGAQLIREAIQQRGTANIILATGGSQFELLEHLVQIDGIHWPEVTVFHLDEYVGMPITHPASFRRFLWQRFVSLLPLPLRACHYINAENDPQQECARVGEIIVSHPIDVAFVGIGENGHMAFNDPPADFETKDPYLVVSLDERCRRQQVGEGWFQQLTDVPKQAVSMSVHQILASRVVIASVPDKRKAQAVKDSVENLLDPRYPATCLQKHERAYIFLDLDSASLLAETVTV
jgi:glucosamine-6-phosphate deaminase